MKVTLTPIVAPDQVRFRVSGESLWVNDAEFDLSDIAEGEERWSSWLRSPWIVGYVRRRSGEIEVSLLQPVAADSTDTQRSFTVIDGWPA